MIIIKTHLLRESMNSTADNWPLPDSHSLTLSSFLPCRGSFFIVTVFCFYFFVALTIWSLINLFCTMGILSLLLSSSLIFLFFQAIVLYVSWLCVLFVVRILDSACVMSLLVLRCGVLFLLHLSN